MAYHLFALHVVLCLPLEKMMRFGQVVRICDHTFLPGLLSRDSVVADLGANYGEFSHQIIHDFGCQVVAAEPVTTLREGIALSPKLTLLPVALGGHNETVTMNLYSARCASILGAIGASEQKAEENVKMVTLEEFCRLAEKPIDLLKVDIEGAEIDLFNNSSDSLLRSFKQITVEFHDFIYPEIGRAVENIKTRMGNLGFWVIPFSLDNTDVLFLNRSSGVSPLEVYYIATVVKYGRGIIRRLLRLARI